MKERATAQAKMHAEHMKAMEKLGEETSKRHRDYVASHRAFEKATGRECK